MSLAYKERQAIKEVERVNAALDAEYLVHLLTGSTIRHQKMTIMKFTTPLAEYNFNKGVEVTASVNAKTGQFIRFDFHI